MVRSNLCEEEFGLLDEIVDQIRRDNQGRDPIVDPWVALDPAPSPGLCARMEQHGLLKLRTDPARLPAPQLRPTKAGRAAWCQATASFTR